MSPTLLDIRNLTIRPTGSPGSSLIVDDVSLRIERGSVLALIGESGAESPPSALPLSDM